MLKKIIKLAILAAAVCAIALSAAGCAKKAGEEMNPIITMELENGGKIVIELYPSYAPNTVANFVSLAENGFYDGLTFHRAVPGFMIQGGCPEGTGTGGPGYYIAGEFSANKFRQNTLSHTRGVISMARSTANDSAGSQFFICVDDASFLDTKYAAFGMVTEGMEYVDEIVGMKTSGEYLVTQPVIKSVTVDTKGVTYKVVKK